LKELLLLTLVSNDWLILLLYFLVVLVIGFLFARTSRAAKIFSKPGVQCRHGFAALPSLSLGWVRKS